VIEADDEPALHDLTMDVPASVLDVQEPVLDEPAPPVDRRQLSVVVVFYDMKREAARTLRSLTRAYQQGIDDLDYEVVVVENGSSPDQRLGAEYVAGFGPEFRYVDMGPDAPSSPVDALNRGIAESTGENLALMIDGAHVLTPGVLRHGLHGLSVYGPAIVGTQQWYVGPGQQGELMNGGYDRSMEDRLFERIEWPADGYRLFDIGHFIGERDWFDGMWESNCLFAPRDLVEQSGAFDESFDMPGGGYANLDLFERLGASPDVTVVTILGEGSFHQLHHGTTTNQTEIQHRHDLLASYRDHYEALRGRDFVGPGKDLHFVGSISESSRRTRARRQTARLFWEQMTVGGPDGVPEEPLPMPQELTLAFTEAFWQSLAWKRTTWLGQTVEAAPTDLLVYQELLAEVRPEWVVVTGDRDGGRALFAASICELLGHGQVLTVLESADDARPAHPRVECLEGDPCDPTTQEAVRATVGAGRALLVIAGPRHQDEVLVQFDALAPLVSVGSYAIVEGSVVNGAPVWPGYGPGPNQALKRIRAAHPDFMADLEVQKYSLTFNPEGYLKRIR
jgi:cephalosporin hydroxylase